MEMDLPLHYDYSIAWCISQTSLSFSLLEVITHLSRGRGGFECLLLIDVVL